MQKKSVVLFAMLWSFSVLLAFGLGAGTAWHVAATRTHAGQTVSESTPPPKVSPLPDNASAEAAVDPLPVSEGASDPGENDRLRVAFRQALKQVVEKQVRPAGPPAPPHIQALWDRAYARWKQMRDSGMFGGLDENMSLMADMSRMGATGMKFLASMVGNGQRPMDERELALSVLSHIQDGAALGAILELNAPDVTELDYPYDLIETQVASLPTRELRPYIAQIIEQADRDLGANDSAPERAEVLAILALVHGDQRAQGLLHDERILQEDLSGAVQTANEIHTPAARQYLQWVLDNHPRPNVQQAATTALQEW
jgi:hypothetical protein